MTELEMFHIIDASIETFKKNEGLGKNIQVSKKPRSDWLVFNWRQLTWSDNGLKYLIEIYPVFDKNEKVSSWTLYTAASYDLDNKRFYINHSFAKEKELRFIADNIDKLLSDSFKFITKILKNDIPFGTNLM